MATEHLPGDTHGIACGRKIVPPPAQEGEGEEKEEKKKKKKRAKQVYRAHICCRLMIPTYIDD